MRKLLVLVICLAFPATADAHHHKHHKHHHKAHKAAVETPECWEVGDTLECNEAEEIELARIEAWETEHPEPVEEALTEEWSGLPEG